MNSYATSTRLIKFLFCGFALALFFGMCTAYLSVNLFHCYGGIEFLIGLGLGYGLYRLAKKIKYFKLDNIPKLLIVFCIGYLLLHYFFEFIFIALDQHIRFVTSFSKSLHFNDLIAFKPQQTFSHFLGNKISKGFRIYSFNTGILGWVVCWVLQFFIIYILAYRVLVDYLSKYIADEL